jgi:hypothetical protein
MIAKKLDKNCHRRGIPNVYAEIVGEKFLLSGPWHAQVELLCLLIPLRFCVAVVVVGEKHGNSLIYLFTALSHPFWFLFLLSPSLSFGFFSSSL